MPDLLSSPTPYSPLPAPSLIWLARHAETARPGVFHGAESDIGLGDRGRRQAVAAAGWFAERRPTLVVSSGMVRAVDTARPIAEACGVPHVVVPELHERRVGDLSGTDWSDPANPWHGTVRAWLAGDAAATTPGAESFAEVVARCEPAFDKLAIDHPGGRVVVIAHGIVCKAILLAKLGWGCAGWERVGRCPNLAVTEYRYDGRWAVGDRLAVPEAVTASVEA